MPWPIFSRFISEVYRRHIDGLESFQKVRVIDTSEIIPEVERGEMFTYQMRVYNLSSSSSIENCRAKLRLRTEGVAIGRNIEVETTLCWAPNKGTVTINRDDHEWLNLATIRPTDPKEPNERVRAEILFPTESGVLNPATVKLGEIKDEETSESLVRSSLPVLRGLGIFGRDNIRITAANRPIRRYNLSINDLPLSSSDSAPESPDPDSQIYVSVEGHRKRLSKKIIKRLFNIKDTGWGDGVPLHELE